jgi:hypothetical protein
MFSAPVPRHPNHPPGLKGHQSQGTRIPAVDHLFHGGPSHGPKAGSTPKLLGFLDHSVGAVEYLVRSLRPRRTMSLIPENMKQVREILLRRPDAPSRRLSAHLGRFRFDPRLLRRAFHQDNRSSRLGLGGRPTRDLRLDFYRWSDWTIIAASLEHL